MARIAINELNIKLKSTPRFIGIFGHFYDDSIHKNISIHYVNLAYDFDVDEQMINLLIEQHSEY